MEHKKSPGIQKTQGDHVPSSIRTDREPSLNTVGTGISPVHA